MNTTTKSINQNKMKQTAVEWFFKKLNENQDKTYKQIELIFNQAKEMEKEQMRYFIQVGYYAHSQGHKKDDELYNYWIDNYNRE
jgi:hypothetical protein